MEKLIRIVKGLKEIRKSEFLQINDEKLLTLAVSIYLKEDGVSSPIQEAQKVNGGEGITEKQKNFLIKSGYDGRMDLTKEEAKILIKTYLENQKETDY